VEANSLKAEEEAGGVRTASRERRWKSKGGSKQSRGIETEMTTEWIPRWGHIIGDEAQRGKQQQLRRGERERGREYLRGEDKRQE